MLDGVVLRWQLVQKLYDTDILQAKVILEPGLTAFATMRYEMIVHIVTGVVGKYRILYNPTILSW